MKKQYLKKLIIFLYIFQTTLSFADSSSNVVSSNQISTIYKCDLNEKSKQFITAQTIAEQAVVSLPNYKKLQKKISKDDRILLDSRLRSGNDQKIKHCVWEVSVYTDFSAENRRMLWHVFLVDRNKVRFQMDSNGEFIKIK